MRHRILTCKNHPDLRWSCKDIAVTEEANGGLGGYNGMRSLFYKGVPTERGLYSDKSGLDCSHFRSDGTVAEECDCSVSDLVLAPEDALVE